MYSGITKIYYPKPVGHVFFSLGICQRPGIRRTIATWPPWPKVRIIAAVKNIDAPMLMRVWQELV